MMEQSQILKVLMMLNNQQSTYSKDKIKETNKLKEKSMFIEVQINSTNIDNLMKYLLYELKVRNLGISRTLMIKLIFKIKKSLGNSHELYSQLPYYWYFYGPFSEPISDSFIFFNDKFERTSSDQIILKEECLNEFNDLHFISKYPEIELITKNLLNGQKFYKNIKKDIYTEYAPFDIMYPFKFKVFDIAHNLRSAEQFDNEEFIKNIFRCESKLPCNSYYTEYNNIFSKFITNLDYIYAENRFSSCWNFLRDPIKELWKTFTKGVRVENKDDYYDYKEPSWKREYLVSLKNLSIIIDETNKLVHLDELQKIDYTSTECKMVNATIGGYLRG